MRVHSFLARLFSAVGLSVGILVLYTFGIRPSLLRRGATPEEIARVMPGDGVVRNPTFLATRAITIRGRAEDIWPWLVQMGYDRAGFYGYDLIENLGSKYGIHSARHIVRALQHPAVGDRVYMSRIAYLVFDAIVPDQYVIWKGDRTPSDSAFTWALYPVDATHTRLVSRIRIRYHWTDRRILLDLFTDFADPVAVPKILEGIKDRVEGRGRQPLAIQAVEIAVWMLSLLEFVVALIFVFRWQQWWKAWMLALAAAGVFLVSLYARQPVRIGAITALAVGTILILAARFIAYGQPARTE